MINSNMLVGEFKYSQLSNRNIPEILHISEEELRNKLRTEIMESNEREMFLHFPTNPMKIFFSTYDYEDPEKIEWFEKCRVGNDGSLDLAR